jgi:hypothetical protein
MLETVAELGEPRGSSREVTRDQAPFRVGKNRVQATMIATEELRHGVAGFGDSVFDHRPLRQG